MTTTLAEAEARFGLLGMDPARRARYLARMDEGELDARYLAAVNDDPDGALTRILADAITARDEARKDAERHAERAAAWAQTPRGREHARHVSEWEDHAHREYLRAEEACPVLLSPAGEATGRDAFPMLWEASPAEYERMASDDLKHWVEHGELTITTLGAYLAGTFWTGEREADWRDHMDDEPEEAAAPAATAVLAATPAPATGEAEGSEAGDGTEAHSPGDRIACRRAKLAAFAAREQAAKGTGCRHTYRWRCEGTPAGACEDCPMLAAEAADGPRDGYTPAGEPATITGTVAIRPPAPVQVSRRARQIDGEQLWAYVRRYLATYVAFRNEADLEMVTAWVFHASARARDESGFGQLIWRASPRLLLTSRKRGSGKSTVLDLILILTRSRRGKMPRVTAAKLAQVVGKFYETAVIDEAKTIFGAGKAHLELQGCLLAGYTPRASYEVAGTSLSLFGAVAYAAKEDLITDTRSETIGDLLDRSLTVVLAPPAGPMPEVGERAEEDGELLGLALIAWTDANRGELRQAARDIADSDHEAAQAMADAQRAKEAASLRLMQITRPLRACGRIAGPAAEAAITAALDERTGGTSSAEAAEVMDELSRRFGDDQDAGDEAGRIVLADDGEDDWDDEDY